VQAQPTKRWQRLTGALSLLLLVSTLFLSACTTARGQATDTSAAPVQPTLSPFWQTATARVDAVSNATKPAFRPFESPAPIITTITTATPAAAAPIPANPTGLVASATAPAATPSGSQLLDQTFFSATLGRAMPYFVYLPVGYAESGKRYPVLYMLHGYGGSNTEWIGYGLPETADHMMNAGEIPPMILVLPQGDQAYWVNHANNGERWGDYTAHDVVQQIDATYRTIPDAPHRAVGGLSMGGHAAMQLAINYPGTFGVVGMHSPTLRDYDTALEYFGDEQFFDAHDPTHLVQAHPEIARQLKISVDVGEQDADWHDRTVTFHDLLTRLNIPHAWYTWPGEHDAVYWGGHCADYLRFYATALAG